MSATPRGTSNAPVPVATGVSATPGTGRLGWTHTNILSVWAQADAVQADFVPPGASGQGTAPAAGSLSAPPRASGRRA
jgi:hypothetical protein